MSTSYLFLATVCILGIISFLAVSVIARRAAYLSLSLLFLVILYLTAMRNDIQEIKQGVQECQFTHIHK